MDTNIKNLKAISININIFLPLNEHQRNNFESSSALPSQWIPPAAISTPVSLKRHFLQWRRANLFCSDENRVEAVMASAQHKNTLWIANSCFVAAWRPLSHPSKCACCISTLFFSWIHAGLLLSLYQRSCPSRDHTKGVHEQLLKHLEIWFHFVKLEDQIIPFTQTLCNVISWTCGFPFNAAHYDLGSMWHAQMITSPITMPSNLQCFLWKDLHITGIIVWMMQRSKKRQRKYLHPRCGMRVTSDGGHLYETTK